MAVDRKPTALALKLWLFVAMVPYVTGLSPLPQSLADGPDVFGYATVGAVFLGALISIVGLTWRGEPLNGLVIEQVGLLGIAAGLVLYIAGLFMFLPLTDRRLADVGFATGLCVAVAAGAIWQYATIRRYRAARLRPRDNGPSSIGGPRPHGDHTHG
jgi:predicted tellurium resistance membrane protein TerC